MDSSGAPQWLDSEEQAMWQTLASLVVRLPAALEAQMQRDSGISHFEYLVMAALSMSPGRRLRLSDIAEFTGCTLSRLSNVVTKLQRAGWVERETDPSDGRYTFGVLTDAGLRVVEAAAPGHVAEVRRLAVEPLTRTQQRQLRQAALRILQALDPDGCDPAVWAPSTAGDRPSG